MKGIFKSLMIAGLCACMFSPALSAANNCPEKRSAKKDMTITVQKVGEEYHMCFMKYEHKGEQYVTISCGDRKLFEKYVGKKVKVDYVDVQYFDEHDGECTQEKRILKIGNTTIPKG